MAIFGAATAAHAEDAAVTVSNAIQTELGVFVYPKAEQDAGAQAKDTVECYNSAKQRTGIDPKAAPDILSAYTVRSQASSRAAL